MSRQVHDSQNLYRPDIDGLRAIAVMAVVLFHINPSWLPGGFTGVDIFLVISGYLITGNIIKDANSSAGFSYREFYRRRILRIVPVLLLVLLVALIVGQFIMLPMDFDSLNYSAVSAILSASNIYFSYFLDTSYFAADSNLQPLLHLWSLGVEEQFYFIWPILLILITSRLSKQGLLIFIAILTVASFTLAQVLLKSNPMFAYYMLPARAGELLIGGLLAVWLSKQQHGPSFLVSLQLGFIGLALVFASLCLITEEMGFPGIMALPSTLGSALIILAGHGGVHGVNRILALRPMVMIGLISYSLYLWHWPVLAFYRYLYGSLDNLIGFGLFGLMVILSIISYRFVEKPCRRLRWGFPRTMGIVFISGSLSILMVCAGMFLTKGFGIYALDEMYRHSLIKLEPAPPAYKYPYICQRKRLKEEDLVRGDCLINPGGQAGVLLWGDSNAAHYVGVLGAIAKREGFAFRNAAHSSCPPILYNVEDVISTERLDDCIHSIDVVKKSLDGYSTVVIGAAWEGYFNKNPSFARSVELTVDALLSAGKRVVILGQVPRYAALDRSCQQKALKLPFLSCSKFPDEVGRSHANIFLERLTFGKENLSYFDLRPLLCPEGHCSPSLNGNFLYFDNSHLSMEGSWIAGEALMAPDVVPHAFLGMRVSQNINNEHGFLSDDFINQIISIDEGTVILSKEKTSGWRGSAIKYTDGNSLYLSDELPNAYASYNFKLDDNKLDLFSSSEKIIFRVQLDTCLAAQPLLRLKFRGEIYDALVDCKVGRLTLKGFHSENAHLVFKDGKYIIYLTAQLDSNTREIQLSVFPAVGNLVGRYSKKEMGGIGLDEVSVHAL
jgi:peptidoglycan/LPS O-acetylase OafA/YrhL